MKTYIKIRDFCNLNKGIIEAIVLVLIAYDVFKPNRSNLKFSGTFVNRIGSFFTFKLPVPIYIIFILLLIGIIYYSRVRSKYHNSLKLPEFLVGVWRNDYAVGDKFGSEICRITSDGKYFLNENHVFNLENISVDVSTGTITFYKTRVNQVPSYRLRNDLSIINNNEIKGTEQVEGKGNNYKISYIKIA
jgi:hypothetical protein